MERDANGAGVLFLGAGADELKEKSEGLHKLYAKVLKSQLFREKLENFGAETCLYESAHPEPEMQPLGDGHGSTDNNFYVTPFSFTLTRSTSSTST